MHDIHVILAELPGLGRVRLCECNSVHVSIGPVTINLEAGAFRQMASLVASATERLASIQSAPAGEAVVM
jgi:hypothetical protein